jgi:hypothetical protein
LGHVGAIAGNRFHIPATQQQAAKSLMIGAGGQSSGGMNVITHGRTVLKLRAQAKAHWR